MKTMFNQPETERCFSCYDLAHTHIIQFYPCFLPATTGSEIDCLTSYLLTFSCRLFLNRDPFVTAYTCKRAEINRRPAYQQRQCRKLNPKKRQFNMHSGD